MAKSEAPPPAGYTTVTIYDQPYHLTGQNTAHIERLAALVDTRMRAVASAGRTVDSLRVAVLAALNLADELLQSTGADLVAGRARTLTLSNLLDEVLEEDEEVEPPPGA